MGNIPRSSSTNENILHFNPETKSIRFVQFYLKHFSNDSTSPLYKLRTKKFRYNWVSSTKDNFILFTLRCDTDEAANRNF